VSASHSSVFLYNLTFVSRVVGQNVCYAQKSSPNSCNNNSSNSRQEYKVIVL